ncbi:hypothetical protein C2845_PM09G13830 [Panicum miliaceum]|uniref:Uncharacterized protein n=1 Tax=Panicum miliaceum TaxID=4540 RepID=A0A3L6S150_PANMI|nr:hypothetical protein C2845_PM09G13830 [Panicum miliaceum]
MVSYAAALSPSVMGTPEEKKAKFPFADITNISVLEGNDWLHTNYEYSSIPDARHLDTMTVDTVGECGASRCELSYPEECTTPQVKHGDAELNTSVSCDKLDGEGDASQCEMTCREECITYKPVTRDKSEHVEHRLHVTPGVRHSLLARQNRHFEETVGRKKNGRVVENYGTQSTSPVSTVVDQGSNVVSAISAEQHIQGMGGKVGENHKTTQQSDGITNGIDTQASFVEDGNHNAPIPISKA